MKTMLQDVMLAFILAVVMLCSVDIAEHLVRIDHMIDQRVARLESIGRQ